MNHVAAVRMAQGGSRHEHIAEIIWVTDAFKSGKSSVANIVSHLRQHPGSIEVSDGKKVAKVEVVDAKPPYIRSVADGSVSDNLLTITRY